MKTVAELLVQMSEWDDVAAELRAAGITGTKCAAGGCPVSWYLRGPGRLIAGSGRLVTTVPSEHGPGYVREIDTDTWDAVKHPLPANVNEFAIQFDGGKFPDLEA